MERVLITGSRGFIGSSLKKRLEKIPSAGEVIGIDLSDLDLADLTAVQTFLERCRPSRIVHLAASLERQDNESGRARQWRNTFDAGRNILGAAIAARVPHLIMAGTMEELGNQSGILSPDLQARPATLYGLCKSLLREVAEFTSRREALRIDWFRPFTVYGPGQTGTMLIPYAFQMAREERRAEFTDGKQIRDFLYIDDLLEWLLLAIQIDRKGCPAGSFVLHHLGSQEGTPVFEILRCIEAEFEKADFHLGVKPRSPHEPEVQVAPRYRSLDLPIRHWVPNVSYREGIHKTAIWWKAEH